MELRHLRYFVIVAEEQNVTRASQRLHVSQPALSRQIHDLEDELEVPLFERTAKSIALTAAGRLFLREARAVLERADIAVKRVRSAGQQEKLHLHVGYAPSPAAEMMPHIIREFERLAPNVRVVLHDMSSAEMIGGLRSGQLQAALMVGHAAAKARELRFHKLRTYPIGVAVAGNHPLAKKSRATLEDVAREPLVSYDRQDYADYEKWVRGMFGRLGRRLKIAEEHDGALSLIAAIEAGRGVAVTARSLMSVAGTRIRFVPLSPLPPAMEVGVCVPRGKDNSPVIKTFVQAARSASARIA